jgi:hypothetical protein
VEWFGGREFRASVLEAFPDLAPAIDEDDGIHLVMGALDDAIMDAARHGHLPRARSILEFVNALLKRSDVDPEIPNAVCISFVEPAVLEESETGRQLWKEIPVPIRTLVLKNKNRIERPGE